jgi:Fe-S-cluster containining protein
VKVSEDEIRRIAAFLQVPEASFIQERTRLRFDRSGLALLDKPGGECEFLDGTTCLIQDVKPQQCRDFPNTWRIDPENLCQAIPITKT